MVSVTAVLIAAAIFVGLWMMVEHWKDRPRAATWSGGGVTRVGGARPGAAPRPVPVTHLTSAAPTHDGPGRESVTQHLRVGLAVAAPALGPLLMPGADRGILGNMVLGAGLLEPDTALGGYVLSSDEQTPTLFVAMLSAARDTTVGIEELS